MRKPAPLLEYLEAAFRDSAYALGQLRRKELDKITMEATAKSLTAAANRLHREASIGHSALRTPHSALK